MENTVLTSIANQFGSPVYVYDADKMEHQYKRLTQAFQNVPQLRINYAVKALSNVNILTFMPVWVLDWIPSQFRRSNSVCLLEFQPR